MTSARSTAASWLTLPHWPGWRHLPRETRDTLFLLGVIAWVVAPHVSHLPWWCSALAGCVLLWRAWLALAGTALPGRWVLAALLLASLGATFLTHRTLLGKEAGVTLVVVLMALKTLELRARRDALAVFFLGFFVVLTHFLYSQTLLLALAMVLAVWGLLTGLVVAHMPVGQPSLARAGGLAARMCLFGAPVMVALFVLFPRFGPLWGLPSDAFSGRTGLSDRMEMGHMVRLALDENTAMTVKFDGRAPPPSALYFRGPVLADFDGRRWQPLRYRYWPRGQDVDADLRVDGPALPYEMTVEPTQVAVIPALEMTPQIDEVDGVRLRLRDDMQWHTYAPLRERQRFRGVAYTGFRHGPRQAVQGLGPYLALPSGYNPRTLAWAAALKQQPRYAQADAGTLARAVLEHIRRENFVYTLEPGAYGDENGYHAIDEFWLGRREGFCEHFAAAFVVVMRAMGVPARIVTGYQGAELNPVDGYYLVRNSFAHAWAEFWQPGTGWVRADPTAAVAPSRIGNTESLRARPGFVASAFDNVNPELWRRLRNQWEALNNAWNQWVLNYTRGRQLDLLKQLGFRSPSWQDLSLLLIGLIVVTATAGAAWAWWERRRQDPWVRAYRQMQAHLAAAGLPSGAHTPPRTLAASALQRWGPNAERVARLLAQMEALRYAPASARGRRGAPTLARSLARDLRRAVLDLRHA